MFYIIIPDFNCNVYYKPVYFYINSSLWFSKIISHTSPSQDFNFCVIRKFYGLVAGEVSGVKPYFLNFYIYFNSHPLPDKG